MRRAAIVAVIGALAALPSAAQEAPSLRGLTPEGPADTRREMQQLREELARIASSQARGGADVASARARLQALNVRETALSAELGRDRNRLARLLSALQLYRRHPPPALLVSPDDAREAVRAAILIRAMTPELERRADAFAAEAREIAALRRQAAAASAELFTIESAAAEQRADIEKALAGAAADRALSPGEMIEVYPQGPVGELGRLSWPLNGPVVRRFGQPQPAGGPLQGVSIRTQKDAIVRSPASGVVEFVGPVTGWGVILILRTAGAYHLVLAGLEQVEVAPGQSVASGAPVGRMPDGGQSNPELYLEVRQGGAPVDPMRWLARR